MHHLNQAGFRSSYSLPIIIDNSLIGLTFFNAEQTQAFDPACLDHLELVGNLISLVISAKLASIRTLASTMRTAIDVTQKRGSIYNVCLITLGLS